METVQLVWWLDLIEFLVFLGIRGWPQLNQYPIFATKLDKAEGEKAMSTFQSENRMNVCV